MLFAKSLQSVPLKAAFFYGKTYSTEITRTICDQIGPVRLLNGASSDNQDGCAIRLLE
jgi:hypothetical protein